MAIWREAGPKREVTSVTARQISPQVVEVISEAKLPAGSSTYRNVYTIYGNGEIEVAD